MAKILVADSIAQEGIDLLAKHHEVVVQTGLKEDALCEAVQDVAAFNDVKAAASPMPGCRRWC